MPIGGQFKTQVKSRLAKALGHLNSVYRMVDDEKYCIDVLNQLKAVQSALDRTAQLMLKNHLDTCVVDAVKADDSARVMEELWQLLRKDCNIETANEIGVTDSGNRKEILVAGQTSCCK